MIRSMTGYGTGELSTEQWSVSVEVRSVNHDELKVSPRLPAMLRLKESELRRLAREKLARGHLYISATCDLSGQALDLLIDTQRLRSYVGAARRLAADSELELRLEAGSLLGLPGVVSPEEVPEALREELWAGLLEATGRALDEVVRMRRAEGQNLLAQLQSVCERLHGLAQRVGEGLGESLRLYRERLLKRMEELLEDTEIAPDEKAITREVALMAERSDVSEELVRLRSHLDQFEQALKNSEKPVGKKLSFLVQEMLRESNTMASKLPSSELVQTAVEMKSEVQKLREQVQNVE